MIFQVVQKWRPGLSANCCRIQTTGTSNVASSVQARQPRSLTLYNAKAQNVSASLDQSDEFDFGPLEVPDYEDVEEFVNEQQPPTPTKPAAAQNGSPTPRQSYDSDLETPVAVQAKQPNSTGVTSGASKITIDASLNDDSLDISNYDINPSIKEALARRGIQRLFPIQKAVLDPILQGQDVIGRAKTGSGKTLAFAIPIIEKLLKGNEFARPAPGRPPRALIVEPTRELANQVEAEIKQTCPGLVVGMFYGGVSPEPQRKQLYQGIDIAVGTPGRLLDMLNQGALQLNNTEFLVLDESDMMLDMGFKDDAERIASACAQSRQTLLFSATMPSWVKQAASRYQVDPVTVDLVGEENTGKLADTIDAFAMFASNDSKLQLLQDVVQVYVGAEGKAIVFCQTKRSTQMLASQLGNMLESAPLHGDLSQNQRDMTMKQFKQGKVKLLIATDVAARGLDVPNVDLVLHYELPQNPEAYLHRSGRTGRAGKKGVTIGLVTPTEYSTFARILKDTNAEIKIVPPPSPEDLVRTAAQGIYQKLVGVDKRMMNYFKGTADTILKQSDPTEILATALAALAGFKHFPEDRSLLTQVRGMCTLQARKANGSPILNAGEVVSAVDNAHGYDAGAAMGKVQVNTQDGGMTAVFDLPCEWADKILGNGGASVEVGDLVVDKPKSIPAELVLQGNSGFGRERRGGGGGGYGRRDGGGYGGRGGYGKRRGGNRGYGSRGGSSDWDDDNGGYGGGGYGERRRGGGYRGNRNNSYGGDRGYGSNDRGYGSNDRGYGSNDRGYGSNDRGYGGGYGGRKDSWGGGKGGGGSYGNDDFSDDYF